MQESIPVQYDAVLRSHFAQASGSTALLAPMETNSRVTAQFNNKLQTETGGNPRAPLLPRIDASNSPPAAAYKYDEVLAAHPQQPANTLVLTSLALLLLRILIALLPSW